MIYSSPTLDSFAPRYDDLLPLTNVLYRARHPTGDVRMGWTDGTESRRKAVQIKSTSRRARRFNREQKHIPLLELDWWR